MVLVPDVEPVPLKLDADGVLRVGGTRVTLDTLVTVFNNGATAEEIVLKFPTLQPADVYAVLGYYLRHREEVEGYLARGRTQAADVHRQHEARHDPQGIRDRLLTRRAHG